MKWPNFGKRKDVKIVRHQGPVVVSPPPGIAELRLLKHHGVRALGGLMMGRHSACKSPHLWCGEIRPALFIAHAIPQFDDAQDTPLLAIYLSLARSRPAEAGHETQDLMEFAGSVEYADRTPALKLVVNFASDGTFVVQYGPIFNPVEGDYSTGMINRAAMRELYCHPEPSHTKWQYWESQVSEGQTSVPELICVQAGGEWNIVDRDRARGIAQQVAWLQVADDPGHNFGIHSRPNAIYESRNDGSEYSRVLQENRPSGAP